MKFCRYCGIEETEDDAIYCEKCGKPFSNFKQQMWCETAFISRFLVKIEMQN